MPGLMCIDKWIKDVKYTVLIIVFFSVSGSFGVCCCVREKVFQVEADAPLEIFKYYENDTWVGYLEFEEGGAQKNVLYKSQIINDWTRTNIKEVRQTVDIKTVFFKRN